MVNPQHVARVRRIQSQLQTIEREHKKARRRNRLRLMSARLRGRPYALGAVIALAGVIAAVLLTVL